MKFFTIKSNSLFVTFTRIVEVKSNILEHKKLPIVNASMAVNTKDFSIYHEMFDKALHEMRLGKIDVLHIYPSNYKEIHGKFDTPRFLRNNFQYIPLLFNNFLALVQSNDIDFNKVNNHTLYIFTDMT